MVFFIWLEALLEAAHISEESILLTENDDSSVTVHDGPDRVFFERVLQLFEGFGLVGIHIRIGGVAIVDNALKLDSTFSLTAVHGRMDFLLEYVVELLVVASKLNSEFHISVATSSSYTDQESNRGERLSVKLGERPLPGLW